MLARAAIPSRKASGKLASASSGILSARRPVQVNARVTQRSDESIVAWTIPSRMEPSGANTADIAVASPALKPSR
ncbi:hypothetical protein A5784_20030 [Mycobacterium sp. 852013-50091_SCH5140682]|uniref:hypothetical protein n=1 Tax=Mycobacterium sp. 852013-50091_SCH5140682 TaxID=1834109 RepID=UPI0007EB7452|nr:hypothetical protein [Mycobacterium sp. 852013-50091_SCH5140682]OBC00554.1 hypothetical protein A5784_20030 [Mycobacterium sp. 852013-50091_SCH5140682]